MAVAAERVRQADPGRPQVLPEGRVCRLGDWMAASPNAFMSSWPTR